MAGLVEPRRIRSIVDALVAGCGDVSVADGVTPMVIVLTLADSKMIEHRDCVGYAPLLAAGREERAWGGRLGDWLCGEAGLGQLSGE